MNPDLISTFTPFFCGFDLNYFNNLDFDLTETSISLSLLFVDLSKVCSIVLSKSFCFSPTNTLNLGETIGEDTIFVYCWILNNVNVHI